MNTDHSNMIVWYDDTVRCGLSVLRPYHHVDPQRRYHFDGHDTEGRAMCCLYTTQHSILSKQNVLYCMIVLRCKLCIGIVACLGVVFMSGWHCVIAWCVVFILNVRWVRCVQCDVCGVYCGVYNAGVTMSDMHAIKCMQWMLYISLVLLI